MNAIFILEWHCGLWKYVILTQECAFSIWIITPRRNVQHVLCASHIHFHHSCFSSLSGFLFIFHYFLSLWKSVLSLVVCVIQHRKHKVWIYFCFATLLCGAAVRPKSKFHPFPTHAVLKELHPGAETTETPTVVMYSNVKNIEDLSPYCIAWCVHVTSRKYGKFSLHAAGTDHTHQR